MLLNRIYQDIEEKNLYEMKTYAEKELNRFFKIIDGKYKPFQNSLIAICLCQGAALHYIDHRTGVKDIDIYFFFSEINGLFLPYRARKSEIYPFENFGERQVDFFKRAIPKYITLLNLNNQFEAIQNYLDIKPTNTAYHLAKKAVIGLWPDKIFSQIIWPLDA